jgi:tRNA nucleotidyltransferase (CCA-adding enzyme)
VSDVTLRSLDLLPPPRTDAKPDREMQRIVALVADLAPRDAERALRDLRFSNKTVAWVSSVLRGWNAIGDDVRRALSQPTGPTDAALRRWAGTTGRTRARAVWRLGAVRFAAERELGKPAPTANAVASAYRRAMRIAFRDPVEVGDLAVDGDDLLSAGVPAGPGIKTVLERLLDDVLEDPARNTRDALLARVATLSGRG